MISCHYINFLLTLTSRSLTPPAHQRSASSQNKQTQKWKRFSKHSVFGQRVLQMSHHCHGRCLLWILQQLGNLLPFSGTNIFLWPIGPPRPTVGYQLWANLEFNLVTSLTRHGLINSERRQDWIWNIKINARRGLIPVVIIFQHWVLSRRIFTYNFPLTCFVFNSCVHGRVSTATCRCITLFG